LISSLARLVKRAIDQMHATTRPFWMIISVVVVTIPYQLIGPHNYDIIAMQQAVVVS